MELCLAAHLWLKRKGVVGMREIREGAAQLERLRQRARLSYGLYGVILLAAVIMAFLSNILWAVIIGGAAVLLNLLVCGRDIRTYRRKFREIKLMNEVQGVLKGAVISEKPVFPADEIKRDGGFPGQPEKGVVRIGVKGTAGRGTTAEMADVSFPVPMDFGGNKRKNIIVSGCYMRFKLEKESGMYGAVFKKGCSIDAALMNHYRAMGMQLNLWQDYYVCSLDGKNFLTDKMRGILEEIDRYSGGQEMMFLNRGSIQVFLKGRYLDAGEPQYKYVITDRSLEGNYIPELPKIMQLIDEGIKSV